MALTLDQKLSKWEKKINTKNNTFYFAYLIFLLCLAYAIDEIATNINAVLQTDIISKYFHSDLNLYTIVISFCSAISILTFLYKVLADKYGRKPFIVINTIGLSIGLFLCYLSNGMPLFIIGTLIMYFFTPCDIQVIYVIESSSDKHRSFWLSFSKAMGVLGVSIIPLIRKYVASNNMQLAFLIPSLIGVVVGIISLIHIKESQVFVSNKIAYYKDEIQKQNQTNTINYDIKNNKETASQGGLIAAIKYMIKDKTLFWLFFIILIFSLSTISINNYSAIIEHSNITVKSINTDSILIVYPFIYGALEIVIGLISDKFGRRIGAIFSSLSALTGFLLFIIAIRFAWNEVLTGVLLGIFIGGFFSSIDIFNVISAEKSPTNLRSSILSVIGIGLSVGGFISTGLLLIFNSLIPNLNLGFFAFMVSAPALLVSLIILLIKIPETKSLSLNHIYKFKLPNIKQFASKKFKNKKSD